MEQVVVDTIVNENVEQVWDVYTSPTHIVKWAFADESWYAPRATNDVRVGGSFLTRMQAKDDSAGFDFSGTYDEVVPHKKLAYTMDGDDKRKVVVTFEELGNSTHVKVVFDPENENPIEMQKVGWQAILDNFKTHAEGIK